MDFDQLEFTTSAHLKDKMVRQRVNIQTVQDVLLVWLKSSINENSDDCQNNYNNIGVAYEEMANYSKARLLYERAGNIGRLSLPANPNLQMYKENLEDVKQRL